MQAKAITPFYVDKHGRSIAHPREYFISGFDPETGKTGCARISADQAKAEASGEDDLNRWISKQRHYVDQSRGEKPNVAQINEGRIPLDCRYLDFAPQCHGWDQINRNGGYGSFQIFWSGIWKLTTVATIPYYTGAYGDGRRGFGFVTIGVNIGEYTKRLQRVMPSMMLWERLTRLFQQNYATLVKMPVMI